MLMQPINSALSVPTLLNKLPDNTSSQSIEDKVKSLFAQYTVQVQQTKEELFQQANTIDISNPMEVMQMQNAIAQYSLGLNLVSTLTHKTTGALDTLLKAQ
ncbi:virulence associated protein [Providencia stuartii]|uniref:Virulence associated protein n=2 Tax=Morganellaceae TaxID=1903414 RepID=A0A1S1HSA8_PROST|nr:virulence associated protein [Providencia stuartii]